MRAQDRIKPFCDELAILWSKHPYLRFGQIISNLSQYVAKNYGKDIFYMEEAELLKVLNEFMNK